MTTSEKHFGAAAGETSGSGLSWGAIFAGAIAAAALSLILLMLGVGLGFSAMSPWASRGAAATTLGVSSIIWLALTQIIASGMGGYLAGRLRIKWAIIHTDEVYFRDTAHGFLAWALATLATAALLGSAVGSIVSGSASVAGSALSTVAGTAGAAGVAAGNASGSNTSTAVSGYLTDSLFRGPALAAGSPAAPAAADMGTASGNPQTAQTASGEPAVKAEAARIFTNALRTKSLSPADQQYLAQLISNRTGISQADADKRVTDAYAKTSAEITNAETTAKQAADTARKSAAYAALWMFITLLAAAFAASLSATFGGRRRDLVLHRQMTTV